MSDRERDLKPAECPIGAAPFLTRDFGAKTPMRGPQPWECRWAIRWNKYPSERPQTAIPREPPEDPVPLETSHFRPVSGLGGCRLAGECRQRVPRSLPEPSSSAVAQLSPNIGAIGSSPWPGGLEFSVSRLGLDHLLHAQTGLSLWNGYSVIGLLIGMSLAALAAAQAANVRRLKI